MRLQALSIIGFVLFFISATYAHAYWLEPEKFILGLNEKTIVHLFVGDGLTKDREERPFQSSKTPRFDLFAGDSSVDLTPSMADNATPFYNFSAERQGTYLRPTRTNL